MERLTIDLSESGIDDIGYSNPNDPCGMYDILDLARLSECDDGTCTSILLEISNKLFAYENTGLTPQEVELYVKCGSKLIDKELLKLQKEDAELKARLEKAVELPCEVGSTVYVTVNGKRFMPAKLYGMDENGACLVFAKISEHKYMYNWFPKIYTKKEAEQALKEHE